MNGQRWQHLIDGLGVIGCVTLTLAFGVAGAMLVQEVRRLRRERG